METLYIEAYPAPLNHLLVSIETLVTLFVYKLCDDSSIKVAVKILPTTLPEVPLVELNFKNIKHEVISSMSKITSYCKWPMIVRRNHVIAGVCSVARQLVKTCNNEQVKDLLGFREACLMACAETSVWTRFCEIDMITMAKNVLSNEFENNGILRIPAEISRFEFHMSEPVKMHNVYKVAREQNSNEVINTKIPVKDLNISHMFSEGLYMTLADVILFPCFQIFFQKYPHDFVKENTPLTLKWYEKVKSTIQKDMIEFVISPTENLLSQIVVDKFVKRSLYVGDAPSHRTEKGAFTKQADIENALQMMNSLQNELINEIIPYGYETPFDWDVIPLLANPTGGALPQKRASRKCEQLENLVKAVGKLAKNKKYKIVDFCSGSGHLGILLAICLPHCQIILVENKERSLNRAQQSILTLNLSNVSIVQSNLDYFQGDFDVGVALHACGVATDLVIKACIEKRAHFVSCPCCYGGIKNCHQVTYPLSKQFQKLNLCDKFYLILAHAADQTHDVDNVKTNQGFLCMDVIDTDRRLYAESCGYKVHLGKLQPVTCTNKNNLLVGICMEKC